MLNSIDEDQALRLLKKGEVVALPTETVYGLAGRVGHEGALAKIFSTKARPFFDPLIVHVEGFEMACGWASFDSLTASLAQHFWPGPLSLVLPKKDPVSDLITSGGPKVALRAPQHPIFRSLISQLQEPLAAPSANRFGKTSPTTALHVHQEFSGQVPVVDGGPCERGIESTIVEVDQEKKEMGLLRPGVIPSTALEAFIRDQGLKGWRLKAQTSSQMPGHLRNHYQPEVPLVLIEREGELEDSHGDLLPQTLAHDLGAIDDRPWTLWKLHKDPVMAARHLYADLRSFSEKSQPCYVWITSEQRGLPAWQGILDRLEKASWKQLKL